MLRIRQRLDTELGRCEQVHTRVLLGDGGAQRVHPPPQLQPAPGVAFDDRLDLRKRRRAVRGAIAPPESNSMTSIGCGVHVPGIVFTTLSDVHRRCASARNGPSDP
jgi:hypothetical protein